MEFKKEDIEVIKELYPMVGVFEPIYYEEQVIDFKIIYISDSLKPEFCTKNIFAKTKYRVNENLMELLKSSFIKLTKNSSLINQVEIKNQIYVIQCNKYKSKYMVCSLYKEHELDISQKVQFSYSYIDYFLDSIFITNQDGRILYQNKKANSLYGYSDKEFAELTIYDLCGNNHDTQIKKQLIELPNKGITVESHHIKKDGSKFPVEISAININNINKDEVLIITRDMSALDKISKEAKMFSVSLDIFDNIVMAVTSDFKVSLWNKGAEKMLGYKSEEIIGSSIDKLIPPNKIEEYEREFKVVKDGVIILNFETQRVHKNGKIMDVSLSVSPLYDSAGVFIGAVGVYKDLTEIKSVEEQLKERCKQLVILKEEAESANIAKTQFLANMSHEIRTPIHGIVAVLQLLKLTNLDEEQKKYINILGETTTLLTKVINDILDVTKIESGKIVMYEEPFQLREIINSIYNSLVIEGNAKGLEVGYYMDQNIDFQVIGDPIKLRQILANIINNAIKFTEKGYISLRVNLISSTDKIQKLEFRIKDTGIGIEDNFKDKIFKNFNQGDITTKKRYKGTGLGLAISKQLAILLNGDIEFESKIGEGSTFVFTCEFKRVVANKEKCEENLNNHRSNELTKMIQHKEPIFEKTVLCIDDNYINQEVLESIINRHGYNYLGAYNGNQGIEILKNKKVDIIFMDIQMPDMNGYEVTKIIRDEFRSLKHIPIIAMTAYAMHEDRKKCLEAGMDDYLAKPYEIKQLYQIFDTYLNK